MTAFNYMSHGTQDLYATFLQKQRGFNSDQASRIAIIYAVGVICGGTVVGYLSQHWGRRRVIILCAIFGMLLIPALDFRPEHRVAGYRRILDSIHGARRLGRRASALQRAFTVGFSRNLSGLAYQLGNFVAAYAAQQQAWLAKRFCRTDGSPNYALTMAGVECVVFLAIIFLAAIGPEKRGREF